MNRLLMMMLFGVLMVSGLSAQSQNINVYDLPEQIQLYLKDYFKTENFVDSIASVKRNEKHDNYKIFLPQNDNEVKVSMTFDGGGKLLRTDYNYIQTGDLPLEVMMTMQQQCGEEEVKWMMKSVGIKSTNYKVGTADSMFVFNSSLKLIRTVAINKNKK